MYGDKMESIGRFNLVFRRYATPPPFSTLTADSLGASPFTREEGFGTYRITGLFFMPQGYLGVNHMIQRLPTNTVSFWLTPYLTGPHLLTMQNKSVMQSVPDPSSRACEGAGIQTSHVLVDTSFPGPCYVH